MADDSAFQWLCDQLVASTVLDELEARGTVRLALKQVGHPSPSVGSETLAALLREVLPEELRLRGVEESEALCARLVRDLKSRPA